MSKDATDKQGERLAALDGWRAISILLVLSAHLLPLGAKSLRLNEASGVMGMALFFTLSGFLITRFLLHKASVVDFLIRRIFRIVPLAVVGLLIALPMASAPEDVWIRNLTFTANLPPIALTDVASHYWSLDVEMQFYLGIAVTYALFGNRGLYLIPIFCLLVTLHRVQAEALANIVTWRRVDEILAGGILALVLEGYLGGKVNEIIKRRSFVVVLICLMASCLPASGPLNYIRPYLAATLVGISLIGQTPERVTAILVSRQMAYIAKISFALYIIHQILMYTWFGMGADPLTKYAKRVLLIALSFGLAHLSTYYFEQRCIDYGRRLADKINRVKRGIPA